MSSFNSLSYVRWPWCRTQPDVSKYDYDIVIEIIKDPITGEEKKVQVSYPRIPIVDLYHRNTDLLCRKILKVTFAIFVLLTIITISLYLSKRYKKKVEFYGSSIEQPLLGKYKFPFKK